MLVFFFSLLFPGTECIALARTALSPPAASPRVQEMSLSALKCLFNRPLSSGELISTPAASMPKVVWPEGQAGCGRRGCRPRQAARRRPLCHQPLATSLAGGGHHYAGPIWKSAMLDCTLGDGLWELAGTWAPPPRRTPHDNTELRGLWVPLCTPRIREGY